MILAIFSQHLEEDKLDNNLGIPFKSINRLLLLRDSPLTILDIAAIIYSLILID
jgi:hypothetical protein